MLKLNSFQRKLKKVIHDYTKIQFIKPEMRQLIDFFFFLQIMCSVDISASAPAVPFYSSTPTGPHCVLVQPSPSHKRNPGISAQNEVSEYFYRTCRQVGVPLKLNPRKCCFSFFDFKSKQPIQILSLLHFLSLFCQIISHLVPNSKILFPLFSFLMQVYTTA